MLLDAFYGLVSIPTIAPDVVQRERFITPTLEFPTICDPIKHFFLDADLLKKRFAVPRRLGARYHCAVSHCFDDAVYSYFMRHKLLSEVVFRRPNRRSGGQNGDLAGSAAPHLRASGTSAGSWTGILGYLRRVCGSLARSGPDDNEPDAPEAEGDVLTAPEEPQTKKPPMYKVVILNDDYTPMEFVVHILERFFAMNREKATQIMLSIHTTGAGVAGIFPRDIAETKSEQVNQYAQENNHPLMSTVEMTD